VCEKDITVNLCFTSRLLFNIGERTIFSMRHLPLAYVLSLDVWNEYLQVASGSGNSSKYQVEIMGDKNILCSNTLKYVISNLLRRMSPIQI
jgi:hypothetical protein